jgi:Holliday junction DNA helicase RuvA
MIARITGKLAQKYPDRVIVDVNGVGYLLHIPLSTFYFLPEPGGMVTLHSYTHVREDAIMLYGFWSPDEKEAFELLIGVTKIGPKLALNILSGISVEDFREAIATADLVRLNSVPGVGPKTAERITFELRDKMGYMGMEREDEAGLEPADKMGDEAVSALVNLGYTRPMAEKAVMRAVKSMVDGATLKELIKGSLKILSG